MLVQLAIEFLDYTICHCSVHTHHIFVALVCTEILHVSCIHDMVLKRVRDSKKGKGVRVRDSKKDKGGKAGGRCLK